MLEMVKSAAYLGLEMDEKLDWSPHINKVTAKATRSLNFIRRNLQIGSQSVKSSAYRGLVRPSLDYCSIVWNQGVLTKGSGNAACSPLALHCGGKSYLGAQLDKEGGHLA